MENAEKEAANEAIYKSISYALQLVVHTVFDHCERHNGFTDIESAVEEAIEELTDLAEEQMEKYEGEAKIRVENTYAFFLQVLNCMRNGDFPGEEELDDDTTN